MSSGNAQEEAPWEPEAGALVRVTTTGKTAKVMDVGQTRVHLRPLNGGREWVAKKTDLEPLRTSEALSPLVAQANARSRGAL
jgi:hypothetical protein